jgi:hypothetical protein
MNADEFALRLESLMPTADDLRRSGVGSASAVAAVQEAYVCTLKKYVTVFLDPVLDLVDRYDASKVEIGGFSFGKEVVQHDGLCFFGILEVDPVAVSVESSEILWFYHYDMSVVSKCALNGAHFLDALLEIARVVAICPEDDDFVRIGVENAIVLAGGEPCRRFLEAVIL